MMAPFKETESSQLCVSEMGWRPVRRLTPFEKTMNMKNMLSLLIQLVPPSPTSMLKELSNWTMPWDRTRTKGIRRPGFFSPTLKRTNPIDTRSVQVVRKHKDRRSWSANPLTKKEKVRKHRPNIVFHHTSRPGSSQIMLTEESNIMIQPGKTFVKRHYPRTSHLPYTLRSFPESLKPPIKIMIQFTSTRTCAVPFTPSLDLVTLDSTKTELETKLIETRSEYSVSSKRFNSPKISSSSDSFSSNLADKSSVSSVVMITLPKAVSETLKCASGLSNESEKNSLEKCISKSATSHSQGSTEAIKRNSSFSGNSMQFSTSKVSLSTSDSSVLQNLSTDKEEGGKESRKLSTTYLRKLPRCRKRIKVDVGSPIKYLSEKRFRRRWTNSRKFRKMSREKCYKHKKLIEYASKGEKEWERVSRKRASSVTEPTFSPRVEKPAKVPRITRSVSVMSDDKEREDEGILPIVSEQVDFGKPLKTIASGHTLSSSERITSPGSRSHHTTPVASRTTSSVRIARSMSHTSKFPAKTKRRTKCIEKKETRHIHDANICPKVNRSRCRYHHPGSNKYFLPNELFVLPEKESLLHFIHSISPESKGLSPIRRMFVSRKSVPLRYDSVPTTVPKGRLTARKRPHSATLGKTSHACGRKRSISGSSRAGSATQRPSTPKKSAAERLSLTIKKSRAQVQSETKPDLSENDRISSPKTSCYSTLCAPSIPSNPQGTLNLPLKTKAQVSEIETHTCTARKLFLTPLVSSPSLITPPSSTNAPSSPASWYTASRNIPVASAVSNVKFSRSSARSSRGVPQNSIVRSHIKKHPTQGSRSSSPTTRTYIQNTQRPNRQNSVSWRRMQTPCDNDNTSQLQLPITNSWNSKCSLKRNLASGKVDATVKRNKRTPFRVSCTPTKCSRTVDFKTITLESEKKLQSYQSSWSAYHSVEPPQRKMWVSSGAIQTSRHPRAFTRSQSPISRTISSIGRPASPNGPFVSPNGRPESPMGRPGSPISGSTSPIGRPGFSIDQPGLPIGCPASPIGRPASPIGRPRSPNGRPGSPIGRAISPNSRPTSPIFRPAFPNVVPLSSKVPPASPNVRSAPPNVRSGSRNVRPGSPIVRPISANVRSISPNVRPASPNVRRASPNVRRASPNVRRASPNVRRASLNVRPASLNVRPRSPIVRSGFPNVRTGSPKVRPACLLGRSTSSLSRAASSIGSSMYGILKSPYRAAGTPTRHIPKSGGSTRSTISTECTSNQNNSPKTPAKSRRVLDTIQIVRSSLPSSRKQIPGASCPSSFTNRTQRLSAQASCITSYHFPSSLSSSRCNHTPVRAVSSTNRSLNTTTQSVSSFSRSGDKSGQIACTMAEQESSLNRARVGPNRSMRSSVTDSRTRSRNIRPLSRNTCASSRVTHTPSRNMTCTTPKTKRMSRKAIKLRRIPSAFFFTPDICFGSPSRPVGSPAKCIISPASTPRQSPRKKCRQSLRRNSCKQGSQALPRSPSTSVACTITTKTSRTQTSLTSAKKSPMGEASDKTTTSCPGETLQDGLIDTSNTSAPGNQLPKPYLSLLEKKDSSHKNSLITKIRLVKREVKCS